MKILQIKEKLKKLKIFNLNDIYLIDPDFRQGTLYDWEKKGYVKKIRNKWYIFSDFVPHDKDFYLIANKIYSPSYISLELALNHYAIIPEAVEQITSVTTLKTQNFKTHIGFFSYQSLKTEFFWGYKILQKENIGLKIAKPEKAVLDFLYFNHEIKSIYDFESMRFNKDVLRQLLDKKKLLNYLEIFDVKTLNQRVNILFEYLDK